MLLDVRPDHLRMVSDILQKHVPQYEVWAFGSRAKWTAKEYSDLDLCVVSDKPLSFSVLGAMAEDFSDSDLPWKVDVVDWATTSESFRKIIERDKVVVQEAKRGVGRPSDWKNVALEDVADELTVGYVGPMASEYVDDGIPFLRSLNVEPLRINKKDLKFITPNFHQRIRKSRLTPGDVVIVRTGKPGACTVIPEWLADANCSDLVIVRCGKQLNNRFLAYYVNTVASDHVAAHLVGAVQQHFNVGSARTMQINLPPLPEQKAIAHILGTLDDKIELNRRMNATLEAMARALFQSWFVDFDPVRAKLDGRKPAGLDAATAALFPTHFQESTLGHIPQGWEVRSLDQIAHFLNGLALQKYPPGDGATLPVIKIAQLRKGNSEGADRCNTELAPQYIVEDGDVLFSWSGSLEVELWCGGRGALNQHLFKVTSFEFPKWFYYLWTLYHLDEFRLIAADKATTMGHIQRGHLTAAKVLVPPPALLKAMNLIMAPLIDQIIANRTQSRTLATLRDALLPKLLSGELSVNIGVEDTGVVA